MILCTFRLDGDCRWLVKRGDPLLIELKSLPGWSLVNPLAMFPNDKIDRGVGFVPISEDECHLWSYSITFLLPAKEPDSSWDEKISAFLRNLRAVTKQAALPTEFAAMQTEQVEKLPKLKFPEPKKVTMHLIGSFRLKTQITFQSIIEADSLGLQALIPIFHFLILDALKALESSDYRKAILYGAIALESLARTVLDAEYDRLMALDKPPKHLRIIEMCQAGGSISKKDPIYKLLSDGDNFGRLLHELPLYLSNKSLLLDDQELYRLAVNLYRTRNRIGHGHEITETDKDVFAVNKKGASTALEVACKVFSWHGHKGYVVPVFDSIRING